MKKAIYIIVFFFIPFIGFAQSWEELNNKVVEYYQKGDYHSAISYCEKSIKQAEIEFGKNNENYATSLNNIGLMYAKTGQYDKAEKFYKEAITIRKETYGNKHINYAISLNNLATLYYFMEQYEKAESLFKDAEKIYKEILGDKHPDYATLLNNLAELYRVEGQFEKAETMLKDALKIMKEALGEKNPSYALSLCNLGSLYKNMGQYDKAESLYLESIKLFSEVLNEKHPSYATSIRNLAELYYITRKYDKAVLLIKEVIKIDKEMLGENHPDYADDLNGLGLLYNEMRQYDKAELYIKEALKIRKEIFGKNHTDYANSLNSLGGLYSNKGEYEKSESLYKEALKIRKEVLGENHPDYVESIKNLAALYYDLGQFYKAEPFIIEANEYNIKQLNNNFPFLSESQRTDYLNTIYSNFEIFYSFSNKRYKENPEIISNMFDVRLGSKGIVFNSVVQIFNKIKNSGDENLVNKYNELISFKTKIIKSQDLTIEERKKRGLNLEEYEQKAEELEKELSRTAGIEITQKVSWTDVKNSLKQNEVALEFVDFRLYDKRWTDTTLYCALVVKKDYPYPKLIQLCTEKDLNDILSVSPEKTDSYIRNNNTSKELYKLIFKPFEGELKGADKIYISPSGLVNRISLNSLMTDANEMLIDKYNLYYTGNLKDIIHNEEENKINPNSFNVAVFGGADFDLDSTSLVLNSQKYQISDENRGIKPIVPDSIRKQYESTKLFIGGKWVYLKGTLDEAEKINDIFKQNGITADVFEKGEATESALKSLSYSKQKNSPTVLHIATHGFFFPDISRDYNKMELQRNFGQEMKLQISENPLRRSGLILAGANRFWQGENNIEGVDDGIVTAEEVSMLDLRNTELVVLSACETGLGDIKGGEGVYGLQRAFKVAGAKTIIMSLWKVPDKETVELMELFYTN